MKQRFISGKTESASHSMIASLAVFFVVLGIFWFGVTSVSAQTSRQEKQTLQNAISRGIAHCYALEGTYPESLSYLKEHYGLTYNEDRFFVDYQTLGSNIMPDITVIDKEEGQ